MKLIGILMTAGTIALAVNCGGLKETKVVHDVSVSDFGQTPQGQQVDEYVLTNANGVEAKIISYGAILRSLVVPDRNGNMEDIVLGYDSLDEYIEASPYFGAIVGRYGNRIANGKFTLDGVDYTLAANNGANHLHGGQQGFDKVVWSAKSIKEKNAVGVELSYLSKNGEEGYPGNLNVKVTYLLTSENELQIQYHATTDKATPCNLTHHSYFNLSGDVKKDILDHELWINADYMIPVDDGLIPTGALDPVASTPFDFTQVEKIGSRINSEDIQIIFGGGYDHNWCLNEVDGSLKLQAALYDAQSGRLMEVLTLEPGLQFYSGNFLDGSNVGKGEKVYKHRYGLCLETQHYPDSPNRANFPSTILEPGEAYETKTVYKFSVRPAPEG
tara:strand:- start:1446 stop:2603 length:1158 start_codon:yes stop_codon:yes gene_type:complete